MWQQVIGDAEQNLKQLPTKKLAHEHGNMIWLHLRCVFSLCFEHWYRIYDSKFWIKDCPQNLRIDVKTKLDCASVSTQGWNKWDSLDLDIYRSFLQSGNNAWMVGDSRRGFGCRVGDPVFNWTAWRGCSPGWARSRSAQVTGSQL